MRELTIFVNMFPSGGGYAYLKINKDHSVKFQFSSKDAGVGLPNG